VLEALESVQSALVVVSDSAYVVNCFRDRWWAGWETRGWRNANRRPVANQDLWRPLVEVVKGRPGLQFRWVKGHAGDPLNELADRLANEAAAAAMGQRRAGEPGRGARP
jgi:ribonuclease HI